MGIILRMERILLLGGGMVAVIMKLPGRVNLPDTRMILRGY